MLLGRIFMAEHVFREMTSKVFWQHAACIGIGVAIYLTLQNTIASIANPILAGLKLSATPV
jgi:hypothetical protein